MAACTPHRAVETPQKHEVLVQSKTEDLLSIPELEVRQFPSLTHRPLKHGPVSGTRDWKIPGPLLEFRKPASESQDFKTDLEEAQNELRPSTVGV